MQRSNLQQSNFKSQCCMTVGCENFPALHAMLCRRLRKALAVGDVWGVNCQLASSKCNAETL